MTRKKIVMPDYQFDFLVDQAKGLGATTISIFGYGEPLMDKDIVRKVQYCTDRDLDTFITTNGSLLKIELANSLLNAGLKHIRFSVHGLFDEYEAVHKGLKFATTQRNISNFKAISDMRHRGQCRVSISVIPLNGEDIENLKLAWKGYELEVWKPHNWSDGRNLRDLTKKRKKTCGRPHSGPVQINADGNMMVCCFDYDAKMIVGNTYKDSIEDILKGIRFNAIRRKHETSDLKYLPCETCDQLNIGDSPLLYSTVDPTCQIGKTSSTKFKLKEK